MNKVVANKIPNMSNEPLLMNITLQLSKGNSIYIYTKLIY